MRRVRRFVRDPLRDEEENRLAYIEPASGVLLLVSINAAELR